MVEKMSGITMSAAAQQVRRVKPEYVMDARPVEGDTVTVNSDVMKLVGVQGLHMERVMAVKNQIAVEGDSFFSKEKLDKALDKALDEAIGQLFSGR